MTATRTALAGTCWLAATAILIGAPVTTAGADEFLHVTPDGSLATTETPIPGPLHSTMTFGVATNDYFRGAFDGVQEDLDEVNGRVGLSVSMQLLDDPGSGGLTGLSITGGSDNGLTNGTAADDGDWHESNNYVGLAAELGDAWAAGLTFTYYATPDISATDPLQEVALAFGYTGDSFVGAMGPEVKLAKPVDETDGWFTQLSLRPSFPVGQMQAGPVVFAVPMEVGVGFDDYYGSGGDDTGVYGSVGAELGVPLGMPRDYGNWMVTAGVGATWRDNTIERAGGPLDDGGDVVIGGMLTFSVAY